MSSEPTPSVPARGFLLAALLLALLLRAEYLRELILTPFWRNLVLDAEW